MFEGTRRTALSYSADSVSFLLLQIILNASVSLIVETFLDASDDALALVSTYLNPI